jgi:hypothetical protein
VTMTSTSELPLNRPRQVRVFSSKLIIKLKEVKHTICQSKKGPMIVMDLKVWLMGTGSVALLKCHNLELGDREGDDDVRVDLYDDVKDKFKIRPVKVLIKPSLSDIFLCSEFQVL